MPKIKKLLIKDVPALKKDVKVKDAVKAISAKPYGCCVVLENNKPVGIITESDIIRNMISKKISDNASITRIMSSPVTTMDVNASFEQASKIIDTKHYRRYPVVGKEGFAGIVTENEVVHAANDNIRFHRNLQNWVLIIFVVFEFFVFILYRHIAQYVPFLK